MKDEYFGVKELYEVVLKAKTPMQFGERYLEAQEPVLYFEKVKMAVLSEQDRPIMARGGWLNMPRVVWEDRSEVQFTLTEGVMTNVGMGILLSSKVASRTPQETLLIPKREGPKTLKNGNKFFLKHNPVTANIKKTFIYEYDRDVAQKKMYGRRVLNEQTNSFLGDRTCIEIYEDKELTIPANPNKEYIIDYYYEYTDEALIYTVQKERFTGLFTLEGKFYSKDENDGINYTNLIYMPKVRVVSDINLRLGERADPTTAVFHIIGLPEYQIGNKEGVILQITHLNGDIDEK